MNVTLLKSFMRTKTMIAFLFTQLGFMWFFFIDGPCAIESVPFPIASSLIILFGGAFPKNSTMGKKTAAILMFACNVEMLLIVLLELYMVNYGMG